MIEHGLDCKMEHHTYPEKWTGQHESKDRTFHIALSHPDGPSEVQRGPWANEPLGSWAPPGIPGGFP